MLPDSRLLLLILIAGLAAGGWWKRAELKAWLFPPEPIRTDVYSWRDADGNRHYSDRAVKAGAARVEVDTAKIGRLEPLPEPAVKTTQATRLHAGSEAWRKNDPLLKEAKPTTEAYRGESPPEQQEDELYLRKMGRELKEQRERMSEKQMEKAIYGP